MNNDKLEVPRELLERVTNPDNEEVGRRARLELCDLLDALATQPRGELVVPVEAVFYIKVYKLYGFGPDSLCMLNGADLKRIWNACIDEVKRLNP